MCDLFNVILICSLLQTQIPFANGYQVESGENGRKFKSLRETYSMYIFLLILGLMYPNPPKERKRITYIILYLISLAPAFALVSNDIHQRIKMNDMANLTRQLIIIVSLSYVVIKLILSILRREELKQLLDKVNEDYEEFNNLPDDYHQIIEETIEKTKIFERAWIVILGLTTSSFPVLAGVFTLHSQLFTDNPKRFMVHECIILFLDEEEKYKSPFFELYAVYTMYIVYVLFIGFSGYEGMFSVFVIHVSLKIKILNHTLAHFFDDPEDIPNIKRLIANLVNGQCEVDRMVSKIEKCYEIWLAGIFFNAILQIGMTLIQVTSNAETDINIMYYFYAVATAVHIFVPCYLATDITTNAAEMANVAYSNSWESVQDIGIRKSIWFIISKAQIPVTLNAVGMLTFNMELFVSILQTAYSMYTLLRN